MLIVFLTGLGCRQILFRVSAAKLSESIRSVGLGPVWTPSAVPLNSSCHCTGTAVSSEGGRLWPSLHIQVNHMIEGYLVACFSIYIMHPCILIFSSLHLSVSYSKREQTFAGLFFQDDVSDGIKVTYVSVAHLLLHRFKFIFVVHMYIKFCRILAKFIQ